MKVNVLPRRAVKLCAVLAPLFLPAVAHAAGDPEIPRFVRLEYVYPAGPLGKRCPPRQEFRDLLITETNRDPFNDVAPGLLRVLITRRGLDYEATIELRDPKGADVWPDGPPKPSRSCDGLAQDVAFAVGLVLRDRPPPSPPPPPPPPPPIAPHPVPDAAPRVTAPISDALRLNLGIAGAIAVRTTGPELGFNLALDAGLRFRSFSGALEFRWSPRQVIAVDTAGHALLRVEEFSGVLVPCGHLRAPVAPFLCGMGQVIAVRGLGAPGTMSLSSTVMVSGAAGVRVGADLPLPLWGRRFAFRLSADALVRLRDIAIHIADANVGGASSEWVTPRFTAALNAGIVTDLGLK